MTKHSSSRPVEIMLFMIRFEEQHGYPPTIREIAAGVGLSSTSAVHAHVRRMEHEGDIRRESTATSTRARTGRVTKQGRAKIDRSEINDA